MSMHGGKVLYYLARSLHVMFMVVVVNTGWECTDHMGQAVGAGGVHWQIANSSREVDH